MRKSKSLFYVFATLVMLIIIGVIFISRERPIPSVSDKPKIEEPVSTGKIPVKKEPSITPAPSPEEPGEKEVSVIQKSPESSQGLTISGRVTLSNGSPASEAKIKLSKIDNGETPFDDAPLSETTADKNGNYSISTPVLPVIFIKASYPGYATLTSVAGSMTPRGRSTGSGDKQTVTINFSLTPASYIKGQVVDQKDNPISGASVMSTQIDRQNFESFIIEKTVTDNEGRFDISSIPAGKINVGVSSPNYAPQTKEIDSPADNLVIKLLPATATLSGRVYHKITGEAITSATVRLVYIKEPMRMLQYNENKATTDQTGFYSFPSLASGEYIINAQKEDLFMFRNNDLPNNRVELKENEKKEGLNLYLYEGHTLKGCVTDKNTGAPLEGVKVSTAWGAIKPLEDITGADGFYMLKGLSGTQAGLTAEKENYILAREENYNPQIRITLDPDILEMTKDLQMIPGLFISGRVETDQGVPATSAKVYLYQMNDWTSRNTAHSVDQIGMFKLTVAPFTSCFVKATVEGFPVAFSDPINVQDKSIENIIVVIKQAATISGMVQDEDNKPVEGAKVVVQISLDYGNMSSRDNLADLAVYSDFSGRFKAGQVPSGNIFLYAEKDGYAKSKQEKIPITSGEEKRDVLLQLTKPAILSGKVTDPEGKPIAGVNIHVYANISGINSHGTDQTDGDGRYRIEGLYNAPHNVSLNHNEYGNDFHQNVQVNREDADFVLGAKNKSTLIGNVKDWKTGNPIADFNVSGPGLNPEKDGELLGRFIVKNLNPEMGYRLKIESEGYIPLDTGYFSLPKNENTVERTYEMGPGGGVKGRVVASTNSEPLEGVGVHLFTTSNEWEISQNPPSKTITTQKDGLFQFDILPAGTNFIRFIPEQPLSPKLKSVTVKHGDITDMGDVEMSGGGIIRGKLVQMPDEIPVPGKSITLQRSSGATVQSYNNVTDEQGRFEFTNVMSGRYFIQANEYNISEFAEVIEDETNEYILRIGTGVLKGVVLKKGVPQIAYVNLSQTNLGMGKRAQTDEKGVFEISGLAPGKWKATFYVDGYSRSAEELVDILSDKITEKVFELPSGRIVGHVVNAKDEPVEGAQVSARLMQVADAVDAFTPRTWTAESDKDGAFAMEDMLSTSYAVSASKKDMGLVLVENVLVPENADSAPVLLRLDAGKGGTLVSVALNLTNGQPVPEAWCYLTTSEGVRFDHGKTRGQDGVVTIPNIPAGTYQVQVSSFGFSVHEHVVEIKDGETANLEDVMYEAGALRWTILDVDGNPVPDALCRIEPLEANSIEKPREGRTDVQGLWIQRGLYPGGYRMSVSLADGRKATDTMEIQAHQLIQKTAVVK
jgi:protocatechuate 3,4-dioxygenase beta subunit